MNNKVSPRFSNRTRCIQIGVQLTCPREDEEAKCIQSKSLRDAITENKEENPGDTMKGRPLKLQEKEEGFELTNSQARP